MRKRFLSILLVLLLTVSTLVTGCQTPVKETPVQETPAKQETVQEAPKHQSFLTEDEKDLSVRDAKGYNGVVASANPIASKIGLEILKKGGNAVDAAVAASFAIGLVEPNAAGVGGSGYMLVHDNKADQQVFYDYMETAPSEMTKELWLELYENKNENKSTGKNACIPGAVDGWLKALEEHGTMTPAEVLESVIKVAEEGFEVPPHLAHVFMDSYDKLALHEETMKVFTKDGLPYEEGEVFKNPDYAKVLKKIAAEGRDGFYKGDVAKSIVDSVRADGGYFTMEDMANYETKTREPLRTIYRGYEILAAAPSSTGGVPVIEALNILEGFELSSLEPNSPEYLNLLSQALYIAHTDRYHFVGDPDFNDMSKGLLSKDYANERRKEISKEKVMEKPEKGNPQEYESPSTSHISVVDKDGNMVSVTNTVGLYFGCTLAPEGTGFVLNSHLFNFSKGYEPNIVAPGKRPRSTMAPILIFKDDKPYVTIGTPGGARIVSTMVQMVSHLIDHEMNLQEMIDNPRIHMWNKMPLYVEARIPQEVQDDLAAKGYEISVKGEMDSYFGGVQGIIINQENGERYGAADQRRDGKALAY